MEGILIPLRRAYLAAQWAGHQWSRLDWADIEAVVPVSTSAFCAADMVYRLVHEKTMPGPVGWGRDYPDPAGVDGFKVQVGSGLTCRFERSHFSIEYCNPHRESWQVHAYAGLWDYGCGLEFNFDDAAPRDIARVVAAARAAGLSIPAWVVGNELLGDPEYKLYSGYADNAGRLLSAPASHDVSL